MTDRTVNLLFLAALLVVDLGLLVGAAGLIALGGVMAIAGGTILTVGGLIGLVLIAGLLTEEWRDA